MQVKLTRKLAEYIDGVDLSGRKVGDMFDLPVLEAHLLIAEGWAEGQIAEVKQGNFARRNTEVSHLNAWGQRAEAADESGRAVRTLDRIRQIRRQLEQKRFVQTEHRRVEDSIREELRDSRARTVEKTNQASSYSRSPR